MTPPDPTSFPASPVAPHFDRIFGDIEAPTPLEPVIFLGNESIEEVRDSVLEAERRTGYGDG